MPSRGKLWSSHKPNPFQVSVYVLTKLKVVAQNSSLIGKKELQVNKILQKQIKLVCVPAKIQKLFTADKPLGCERAFCNSAPFL